MTKESAQASTRRQFLKQGAIVGAAALTGTALTGLTTSAWATDKNTESTKTANDTEKTSKKTDKYSEKPGVVTDFTLTDEEQEFFEKLDQELVVEKGFQQMDLEAVKSFYHQDPALRFADADGPYMKGWEEYGPNWLAKIFDGAAVEQHFVVRDVYSYRIAVDTVINTMLIDNKTLLVNDQVVDSTMRLSLIWKETDEGWKVIHEHFSKWTGELADMLGYPNTGKVEIKLNSEK